MCAPPIPGAQVSYITGVGRSQVVLFPESVDEYVGEENEVRAIDAFIESLDMEALGFSRAVPARTGRPGYDPRDLLKLYVYGYLNRVRSSRRLERECQRNVEVMWLLQRLRPDHKTIADFRKEHADQLKAVCGEFVVLCKQMGLLGAELAAIDGSKFRAVNSKQRNYTREELEELRGKAEAKLNEYLAALEAADASESEVEPSTAETLRAKIDRLRERKSKYTGLLAKLDASGESQISLTDPESRLMKQGGGMAVCYNAQISVDAKHHLIVTHDVTNEVNDLHQLSGMAAATKKVLGVEELDVTADAGYHEEDELAACEEGRIQTFVPRPETSNNGAEQGFTKADFTYLAEQDAYRCPGGHLLEHRHDGKRKGKTLRYYRTSACKGCPLRGQCTKDPKGRRIGRTPKEEVVERAEARLKARPEMMLARRCLAEHPFGTIKRGLGHDHFLLKGLKKVRGEFSLSVLSYDWRRVINIVGVVSLLEALKGCGGLQTAG